MIVSKADARLYAVDPENTYTKMTSATSCRGTTCLDQLREPVLDLAKLKGDLARLHQKWIR